MNMQSQQGVMCEGSLALSAQTPRFRVIQGGNMDQKRAAMAVSARHQADSRDSRVKRAKTITSNRKPQQAKKRTCVTRAGKSALAVHNTAMVKVFSIVLALVMACTWLAVDMHTKQSVDNALASVSYETIVVHQGDSLWSIAQKHPVPGCTTDQLVHHIRAYNGIEDACLSCGMRINVPTAQK